MASLSGLFPGCLRPNFDRCRRLVLGLAVLLAINLAGAQQPAYLRKALDGFQTGVPAGWGYTLTTTRHERAVTERFNPARPPAAQWTLLETEGRAPTPDETEKYLRARATTPGGMQPNFERADIEPGSLTLVREDDTHAEFAGSFRETSLGPDKMLGHLKLILSVDKGTAHVSAYTLELKEPYSPVLGVKMTDLRVEARYSAPAAGRPSLLTGITSRFAGRIFFIPTGEDLELIYREHTAPNELSR